MFEVSAEIYDAVYTKMKDYRDEALKAQEWILRFNPDARSLLSVACGTAEHDRTFKERFAVDGLDLNETFLAAARQKNPQGRYHRADMIDFELGRKYDAIACLFSSIGYVRTLDNLERALRCFVRHLNPGGVILVEPWLTPQVIQPGTHLHMRTIDEPEFKVSRINTSTARDGLSYLEMSYLVGQPEGITHFTEEHVLGLFTVEQNLAAFTRAGLKVEHDEKGLFGRGLYVARACFEATDGGQRLR